MKKVTCNSCGWVHFVVSREYAEKQIDEFIDYYKTLTAEEQITRYGGRVSTIKDYEHCFKCGNLYRNFREFKEGDCPDGCTIQSILDSSTLED